MDILQKLHTLVDASAQLPGARYLVEASYLKTFIANRDQNLFHGVYDSFEAAEAQAGEYGVAGYDNEASADIYLDHMRVDAHDYPSMFWLDRSFQEGMRSVFDVGGSIGIKYYAFAKTVPCPDDVRWTVEDVPAVVAKGRQLALQRGVLDALHFTDLMTAGIGTD
ncbi:MAG: methyltransferase, TIGR04325 family, partial [Rhizobacter sp.]|nr:methyltransferase, TIGR04325 family [Rhizobacter sp.]